MFSIPIHFLSISNVIKSSEAAHCSVRKCDKIRLERAKKFEIECTSFKGLLIDNQKKVEITQLEAEKKKCKIFLIGKSFYLTEHM